MLESVGMKLYAISALALLLLALAADAQTGADEIFATERRFEKSAAENGINKAFIEFLSPTGVMFLPDAVNGREAWAKRPASSASLTWNPIWIDVASNGAMAYSIGNSQYRPKGKDDPNVSYGHYISVWLRQPDGRYLAAFDTGINHEKPPAAEPNRWRSPSDIGKEKNESGSSAADASLMFYQMADQLGAAGAYERFLAADAIVMRQGKVPAIGRRSALKLVDRRNRIAFAKRKSFTQAAELAFVHAPYTVVDKSGTTIEKGNFAQVWKLRGKRWFIVADVMMPLPPAN